MKLNPDNVKLEPFNRVKMISAADYAAALKVPGSFNWRRAAHTLLVHLGLNFLLPLTAVLIKRTADDEEDSKQGPDPFSIIGGADTAYAVLRDALSPMHLYAIGTL